MSQPNRLIHSSGPLSFIRCNTDHERTPVSPVTPPLVFPSLILHDVFSQFHGRQSRKFHPQLLTGDSEKKLSVVPPISLKRCHVTYFFACSAPKLGCSDKAATSPTAKIRVSVETQTSSKMWENISRTWHTSLSLITPSILYQHRHSLTQLWCSAFSFSLHLGCTLSQEKLCFFFFFF